MLYGSQSLQDQGTVRIKEDIPCLTSPSVSIPSRSGYRQNMRSWVDMWDLGSQSLQDQGTVRILFTVDILRMKRSQSLQDQGTVRIRHRRNFEGTAMSQSLQDQGTVRICKRRQVLVLTSLNPFKIRVPSEFIKARGYGRRHLSQSLQDQGTVRIKKVLEPEEFWTSQSLQDQGTVRIAVFRQTPVRVANPSSENSSSVVF